MICDGREVSRIKYPALFNAIGTTYGSSKVGMFKIPDYREAALVGVGTRESGVVVHDVYALGQFKDDQFASHTHTQNAHSHQVWAEYGTSSNLNVGGPPSANYMQLAGPGAGTRINSGTFTSVAPAITSVGATSGGTHGKRIGVNYIIKAI